MQSVIVEMVSVGEAAELLALSRQRIVQLEREGLWRRVHGKLRILDVVQGYMRFLKDEARRSNKSAAQSRVAEARAAEIELRTAERARHLVRLDDVMAALDDIVGTTRTELAGVPPSVTRDIVLRRTIEDAIDRALHRTAERLAARGRALRSGER